MAKNILNAPKAHPPGAITPMFRTNLARVTQVMTYLVLVVVLFADKCKPSCNINLGHQVNHNEDK